MFQKGIFVVNLKSNIELLKIEFDKIIVTVNSSFDEDDEESLKTYAISKKREKQGRFQHSVLVILDNYDSVLKEKLSQNIKYLQNKINDKILNMTLVYISRKEVRDHTVHKMMEIKPMDK